MLSRIFGSLLSVVGLMLMVGGACVFPVAGSSHAYAELAVLPPILAPDCKGSCDRCGSPERQNPGVLPAIYKCIRTNTDGTFSVGNCKTTPSGCNLCTGSCSDEVVGGNVVCECDE